MSSPLKKKPNIVQRLSYRMMGVGLILSTETPIKNLRSHFGVYWNLGIFLVENLNEYMRQQNVEIKARVLDEQKFA